VLELSVGTFLTCSGPLASFADAERDCRRQGAELARISSAEQNEALVIHAAELNASTNLWTGGTRDDEHAWRWPDGTLFWTGLISGTAAPDVFINWRSSEPNDMSTLTDESERCMSVTVVDGTWFDRACSLQLSYFCQLPP